MAVSASIKLYDAAKTTVRSFDHFTARDTGIPGEIRHELALFAASAEGVLSSLARSHVADDDVETVLLLNTARGAVSCLERGLQAVYARSRGRLFGCDEAFARLLDDQSVEVLRRGVRRETAALQLQIALLDEVTDNRDTVPRQGLSLTDELDDLDALPSYEEATRGGEEEEEEEEEGEEFYHAIPERPVEMCSSQMVWEEKGYRCYACAYHSPTYKGFERPHQKVP
ncbi:hypothetical protein ASPZODRAFT_19251 [Penicilliopsis zonata CBS 506.65]|uniref:Uncharacterized protein n=1 Tax=Penicilliopsis zonata CBS 506.65 TaxID=1073090 RepID=A0A1L9S8P7_9EURO|nr:hypothetical protein ASPZODRAFT_19251 [Penicilliopsis zonata CBS 506.65]OJJ43527.1 hypothetical protein ASPZODRAFT_19251 [Penicilliopsis zonata CBS 506.65]